MRVSSISMLCVNQWPLDSTLFGISMLIYTVSNRDPTKHDLSRIWLWFFFQSLRPECKIESFHTTGTQRKNYCFSADGICGRCSTVFEALGCFYHFCDSQEIQPGLKEEDVVKGHRNKERHELRWCYLREKLSIIEMWECQWKHHLKKEGLNQVFSRMKFSLQTSIRFPKATVIHTHWWNVLLRSTWYTSSRRIKRKTWSVSIDFQKQVRFSLGNWWIYEKLWRREQTVVSTSGNANIQLPAYQWNNHYTAFKFLFWSRTRKHSNTLLRSIYSLEMF